MPVKMARVQIIGLKPDLLPTLEKLQEMSCVQIDDLRRSDTAIPALHADQGILVKREDISRQLSAINGILKTLGIDRPPSDLTVSVEEDGSLANLDDLQTEVEELVSRRETLQTDLEILPRFEQTLRKLMYVIPPDVADENRASFGLLISRSHQQVVMALRELLADVTEDQAQIFSGAIDEATTAVVVFSPTEYANAISALLDERDISRLAIPPGIDTTTPKTMLAQLHADIEQAQVSLEAVNARLAAIAIEWKQSLWAMRARVEDEVARYEILSHLAQTDFTFVLRGWTPADKLPTLAENLGSNIYVEPLAASPEERASAPVILDNPPAARPFESLVSLLSMPRYEGVDPTRFMALFLPLIFGAILGDVGYGLILLAASFVLKRRVRSGVMSDIASILAMGSVWAILFGFAFGELFGSLGHMLWHMRPLLFDRADPEYLTALLLLTIGMGAAHVLLGLIIGVWMGIRQRNRHQLLERGGRLIGLIALFVLVGVLVDILPRSLMTPAFAGIIVGVAIMGVSIGWTGLIIAPIEFIGLLGNILSYLRIAAVGLASVFLAIVANQIAGTLGSVVVGIIVAVLMHALNVVLGAFSPTIHSLRLHYVEFFNQFYEGGGSPFEPFAARAPVHVSQE